MAALTFVYRPEPIDYEAILLDTLGQDLLRTHPLDAKARVQLQAACHKMKMCTKTLFGMSEVRSSTPQQIRESCEEYIKMLASLRDNHFPDNCMAISKRLKLPHALFQKKVQKIESFEQEAALATRNGLVSYFNFALDQLYQIRRKPDGPKGNHLKAAKGALDNAFQLGELFKSLFGKDTFTGAHAAADAATAEEATIAGAEFSGSIVPTPVAFLEIAQQLVEFCRAAVTYQFSLASDQLQKIAAKTRHSILSQQAMDCVNVALPREVSRTWRQIPVAFYSMALYHKAEDFYNREDITDKKVFRNAWSYAEAAITTLKDTPWEIKENEEAVAKGSDTKNFFDAFAHSTIVGLVPLWEHSRNSAMLLRDKLRKEGQFVHYGLSFVAPHHLEELSGTRAAQDSPFRSRGGGKAALPNPFAGSLPSYQQISENDQHQAQLAVVRKGLIEKIYSAVALGKEQCTRLRATQVKVPAVAEGPIDTLLVAAQNLETFAAQVACDLGAEQQANMSLVHQEALTKPTSEYVLTQLNAVVQLVSLQARKLQGVGEENQQRVKSFFSDFSSSIIGADGVPTLMLKIEALEQHLRRVQSTALPHLGSQETSNAHHQRGTPFTTALRKAIALNALSPAANGGVLSDILQQTANFFEIANKLFSNADPHRLQTLSLEQLKGILTDLNELNTGTYPAVVTLNQSIGTSADLTSRARAFQETCDSVTTAIHEARRCLEFLKGLIEEAEQEMNLIEAMVNGAANDGASFIGIVEDNTPAPSVAGDLDEEDEQRQPSIKKGKGGKKAAAPKKGAKAPAPKKGRNSKRGKQQVEEEEQEVVEEDASPAPRPTADRQGSKVRTSTKLQRAVLEDEGEEVAPPVMAVGNGASNEGVVADGDASFTAPGIEVQAPSQEGVSPTFRSDAQQRQNTSFLSTVSGAVGGMVGWALGSRSGHTKAHIASQLKAEAKAPTPDPEERPRKRQRR